MNITVDLVKQLRNITMASLKDCKDCLIEAEWDLDKAQELLKKKGIASAGKKGDRETKEGKTSYLIQDGKIAVLKLGCETDFVANNELFTDLVKQILEIAIQSDEIRDFDSLWETTKEEINNTIAEVIGKLGENMKVMELFVKNIPADQTYVYTHAGSKLIAIVYYNIVDWDPAEEVKKVWLQIAAMDPTYLNIEAIPADQLTIMKAEFEEEVKASGKPEAVIANIVSGKLNKKYSDIVLMEQWYIWDEATKIKDLISWKASIVAYDRVWFGN